MGGIDITAADKNFSASRSVDAETFQNRLHIGGAHADVLLHQSRMGTLVERLKQGHLGGGVEFGGGQRPAVLLLPAAHGFIVHEYRNRSGGLAVGRDVEDEFGARFALAPVGTVA